MGFIDDILAWAGRNRRINQTTQGLLTAQNLIELEMVWGTIPPDMQADEAVTTLHEMRQKTLQHQENGIGNPLEPVIKSLLNDWKSAIAKYDIENQEHADEKLASLAADVLAISASAAVVELALGAMPNGEGTVASTKVSQLMAWLGFGAVITAVAHDPVKIGLLRPYQDSLEAHFRNRRPGDADLFRAYQQRSLSATKVEDVNSITDAQMARIEGENETYYDREIAKWGYSELFANSLKDAATKTLTFGNLMALAKQGRLNRGMATFSLWGYGLDRRLMTVALDALDQTNEVANYDGFRAVIERGYTDGAVSESDLRAYYAKLHVPADVIAIALPHLTKLRQANLAKAQGTAKQVQRDLTVSQIQQAYEAGLLKRAEAELDIKALGYDSAETEILLKLADARIRLPAAARLKRLPLTDYEKAHKAGLINQAAVLDRMRGEYTQEDIALEKKLLEAGKA